MAGSLNIPAVKTLDLIGPDNAVKTMRDVGITSPLKDCGLSLVLGGCEVTLLDHVSGYSTFAQEGVHHQATGILSVEDANGNKLEEFQDQSQQVLDPQSVYELISILTDNASRQFTFGNSSQYLTLPDRVVAAKTGTTQNYHDGWTVGFTPSLVAGVWTGNNDGTLMKTDAVITAGPIWKQFMSQALQGTPAEDFPMPDGIQKVTVDALSGKLPGPYSTKTKEEIFASFAVPKDIDDSHVAAIDANGNKTIYTVLHSERPNNADWENPVIAWALGHGYQYPPGDSIPVVLPSSPQPNGNNTNTPKGNPPTVAISTPADGASVNINTPFILQASAPPDQGNHMTGVDLLIDGAFIQSATIAPYIFNINSQLSPGSHIFAVHAVDDKDNSADTSIQLKFK